ncbi:MAG: 4-hydroxybenzoate octaprenyltransferase [Planctomycetaceae bacterium]
MRFKVKELLGLIRFSHTIFALPFAALAAVMAVAMPLPDGSTIELGFRQLIAILLCMVFARSAAMAFNRLADHHIDAANPRTAIRHLPSGALSRIEVWAFTLACCIGFVLSTLLFLPNRLPLVAALPVLAFLLGYSLAKRFTAAAHMWLGVALALAPVCVWVALRGIASTSPVQDLAPALMLAASVATWVAGFDMIYACQDAEFDRSAGLHSIPARLGVAGALRVAASLHALTWGSLCLLPIVAPQLGLSWPYATSLVVIGGLLVYQHSLVRPDDLARVNIAFFHVNAIISVLLLVVAGFDCFFV